MLHKYCMNMKPDTAYCLQDLEDSQFRIRGLLEFCYFVLVIQSDL